MKKLGIISFIACMFVMTGVAFASDYYIPQSTTSEVFTRQEQVRTYESSYDCDRAQKRPMYSQKLAPVTVKTGSTVIVKDHYDVYQPRVVYDKVNSYTTTKVCEYCD